MKRALMVVNRHSRSGAADFSAVLEALARGGVEPIERACASPSEMSPLIAAEGRSADLVIVGGGDGTLNAALEGLVMAGRPLGLLPLGTANDLARTLGLPSDPVEAARVIAEGRERRVDLGWVNGKYFANVASVGLSVEVTESLTRDLKRRWGRIGYAVGALRAWRRAKPFTARIRCDGENHKVRALQLSVGNGRHFGGGMTVAEDAAIDDHRLDLFSVAPCGILRFAALTPRLKLGIHGALADVQTCQGREIDLSTDRAMAVNTDGEITTQTPARFRVRPGALTILVPKD